MNNIFKISSPDLMNQNDVELRPVRCVISYRGKEINLGKRMYRAAELLLHKQNSFISQCSFIDAVWPDIDSTPHNINGAINVMMLRLRKVFLNLGAPYTIRSYRGTGFRLIPEKNCDLPFVGGRVFNNVTFRKDERELIYLSSRATLPPQVARIAEPLFEKPNHLVPYERLFGKLWPDSRLMPEVPRHSFDIFVFRLRQNLKHLGAPVEVMRIREEGLKLVKASPPNSIAHITGP